MCQSRLTTNENTFIVVVIIIIMSWEIWRLLSPQLSDHSGSDVEE